VVIPQGFASLLRALPEVLEDGDNELPDLYRPTLHRMYQRLLELRGDIESMTKEVDGLVKQHPVCNRLTAIEGIGPIGALSLYARLPGPYSTAVQLGRQGQHRRYQQEGRQSPTTVDSDPGCTGVCV
jgi:transposase